MVVPADHGDDDSDEDDDDVDDVDSDGHRHMLLSETSCIQGGPKSTSCQGMWQP